MQQPLLLWLSIGVLIPHWCAQGKIVVTSKALMPSLKMKSKVSTICLRERKDLHVCPKSNLISKKPCSKITISAQVAEIDTTIHNCEDGKQLNWGRGLIQSLFEILCFNISSCLFFFFWPKVHASFSLTFICEFT